MALTDSSHIEESMSDASDTTDEENLYIVNLNYTGRNKNELNIKRYDLVNVLENDKNWWLVENESGQRGYVAYTLLAKYQPGVIYVSEDEDPDDDDNDDTDEHDDSEDDDDDEDEEEGGDKEEEGDSGVKADKEDAQETQETQEIQESQDTSIPPSPPPEMAITSGSTEETSEAAKELRVSEILGAQDELMPTSSSETIDKEGSTEDAPDAKNESRVTMTPGSHDETSPSTDVAVTTRAAEVVSAAAKELLATLSPAAQDERLRSTPTEMNVKDDTTKDVPEAPEELNVTLTPTEMSDKKGVTEDAREAAKELHVASTPVELLPTEMECNEGTTEDAREAAKELHVATTPQGSHNELPSPRPVMRVESSTEEKASESMSPMPFPSPSPTSPTGKATRKRVMSLDPMVLSRTSTRTVKPTAKIIEMRASTQCRLTYAEVKKEMYGEASMQLCASEQRLHGQEEQPKREQQKKRRRKSRATTQQPSPPLGESAHTSFPSEGTPFSLPNIKQEIANDEEFSQDQIDRISKMIMPTLREEVQAEMRREVEAKMKEMQQQLISIQAVYSGLSGEKQKKQRSGKAVGPARKKARK